MNDIHLQIGLQCLQQFHANQYQNEVSKNIEQALHWMGKRGGIQASSAIKKPKCTVKRSTTTTSIAASAQITPFGFLAALFPT
jgi:hypothetical protein